jgi:hypothetical protein
MGFVTIMENPFYLLKLFRAEAKNANARNNIKAYLVGELHFSRTTIRTFYIIRLGQANMIGILEDGFPIFVAITDAFVCDYGRSQTIHYTIWWPASLICTK